MNLDEFRKGLDDWLDEHYDELVPAHHNAALDEEMAQVSRVKREVYDAGWMRWGWPEQVGGFGGSTLLRAYLGQALTARDLVAPGLYSMTEVLAPTMISYARPELAAEMVPRLLRGDETWCQGFSEPSTGSNLGALQCRAVRTDNGWKVNGQKVWTSLAQFSQRCVLLTRTGTPESAHRGITAMFVDMDTPGITVRPFATMHERDEFSEVFFDDVAVPFERTLGDEGQGWSVAMDLLPFERSTALWHRGAFLHQRLQALLTEVSEDDLPASRLGEVFQQVYTFHARSRATQRRMAAGGKLGAETSVDKILISTSEQAVFDLASETVARGVTIGDDDNSDRWRSEFLYAKAATIYGGSSEIQRNIIARRLLDLGPDQ